MKSRGEVPPTAGLPMIWRDWLPTRKDLPRILAEMFDLPPLIVECSGTAALVVALKTLADMPENKGRTEVVIPAYNCPLVVFAIVRCNLTVKLCDTQKNHFDFDFDCLDQCVDEKTLAVIPAHIGGQVADVKKCLAIARKKGAYVIEDAAQALGSSAGKIGDIAFFSLAVGKGLTLYEGGLLTARDVKLHAAMEKTHQKLVKSHFFFELRRVAELFGYFIGYCPRLLPLFYGNPRRKELEKGHFEEAVGDVFDENIPVHEVSQLRIKRGANAAARLAAFLNDTKNQAALRIKKLETILAIRIIKGLSDATNIWPFIMVAMPDQQSRDHALKTLWPSPFGVTRLFIHSLQNYHYLQPYLQNRFFTPNADDFARKTLTISNSLWLDDAGFAFICHQLEQSV
ncbi:DegT/DnrJ/EryC1/StrS family aminotransferase [uncultured Bartonella sp.]|uniref:DegT/DnrJ/EryC1/StrS family aminotransferase n=1 Tax=uncultured Bartonella sp. TaxID=104108 RepID=UPI00262862C2|nr:DegT/DnrJ/EryC1/StrS family aminotransferase [uncultured Bartonella sp.]